MSICNLEYKAKERKLNWIKNWGWFDRAREFIIASAPTSTRPHPVEAWLSSLCRSRVLVACIKSGPCHTASSNASGSGMM